MTREELSYLRDNSKNDDNVVDILFEKINDLESRICGNCAYYNVWEMCGNEDSPLNHVNFSLDKDFSCPYFTKAEDED